jgi:hypothetical protein
METLKDFLWPIATIGGLGAFIDFLIGRAGQEKTRDLLLKWWVRFDDVRWRNFGREEGLFAGRLIEQWFGKKIWSLRRIVAAVALYVVFLLVAYVTSFAIIGHNVSCHYCQKYEHPIMIVIIVIFYFCMSISFVRFITFLMADLCGVGKTRNRLVFLVVLVVNYFMLIYLSPFFAGYRESLDEIIFRGSRSHSDLEALQYAPLTTFSIDTYLKRGEIDRTAIFVLACFPSLIRFILSIVFVGSFLLKPLIMGPVNLVWRRIVESDKPVFTLIFGGAAVLATAMSEVAKHL